MPANTSRAPPQPDGQLGPSEQAEAGDPLLLLGGAQADEQQVGPGLSHFVGYGIGVLKIAVMDAAQNDVGVLFQDAAARLSATPGLEPSRYSPPISSSTSSISQAK